MAEVGTAPATGHMGSRLDASGIAALIHWWKLAGVDTPTADIATSWLAPEPRRPEPRIAAAEPEPPRPAPRVARPAPPAPVWDSFDSLEALTARVRADHPRAPFADGNPASGLLILGEAPSAEDLQTGRPFSGPAGQLLDRMLAAIGIDRTTSYITLLCPRARRPVMPADPDDIAGDLPLTRAHIRLASPRHILLLGANPVLHITGNRTAIRQIRGSWLEVEAGAQRIPALATFNPGYLLRQPGQKGFAWADLLALRHRLSQ